MKLKTVLIISAVTTALLIVIMNLQGAPLKIENVTPLGIVDAELARTVNRATEIYNAWYPDNIRIAIKNTFIDFLFLISYTTFLYTACVALSRSFQNASWSKIGRVLARLVVVAGCFDAIENTLMFRTLYGHFNKEIVASTFMFASFKFFLAALAILYILSSLLTKVFFREKKMVQLHNSNLS